MTDLLVQLREQIKAEVRQEIAAELGIVLGVALAAKPKAAPAPVAAARVRTPRKSVARKRSTGAVSETFGNAVLDVIKSGTADGVSTEQIRAALKSGKAPTSAAITKLLENRQIRKTGKTRATRYFAR